MAEETARRIAAVEARIADACRRAGRDRADVTLVAVSKRQPTSRLREAIAAGLRVFGENRVQEALDKAPELPADLEWHLIGPLQSNKVKKAARHFHVIEAVDRLKIARLLDSEAAHLGRSIPIFLQVHLGDEDSKHGFPAEGLAQAVAPVAELTHLDVRGLMAIPPYEDDLERARVWFRRLRELRDLLQDRPEWAPDAGALGPGLSMGMSHDFEAAIEEGATHVRVGTDLFGSRPD